MEIGRYINKVADGKQVRLWVGQARWGESARNGNAEQEGVAGSEMTAELICDKAQNRMNKLH